MKRLTISPLFLETFERCPLSVMSASLKRTLNPSTFDLLLGQFIASLEAQQMMKTLPSLSTLPLHDDVLRPSEVIDFANEKLEHDDAAAFSILCERIEREQVITSPCVDFDGAHLSLTVENFHIPLEGPFRDENGRVVNKVTAQAVVNTIYTDHLGRIFLAVRIPTWQDAKDDCICMKRGYHALPLFLLEELYGVTVTGIIFDFISLDLLAESCVRRYAVMADDDTRSKWFRQILSFIRLYRAMTGSRQELFLCGDPASCRACPHSARCRLAYKE